MRELAGNLVVDGWECALDRYGLEMTELLKGLEQSAFSDVSGGWGFRVWWWVDFDVAGEA